VFLAEVITQGQLLLDKVDQVSAKYGKEVSETKTECILVCRKDEEIATKRIEDYCYEERTYII
jgi:hypothetical protein